MTTYIFPMQQIRHKWSNRLQTWLLAGGSILLLTLTAFIFAGVSGVIWAALLGAVSMWMAQRVSPQLVLRLFKARELMADDAPDLARLMCELTARADLPAVPRLYYVPSNLMNAFAVGRPEDSAIAITDGLLRGLNLRQLAGVLAHEFSHIRNEDLHVMALADMVSRLTSVMSTMGVIALVLHVPHILAGGVDVPWLGIFLLMLSPTIGALLQMALSRTREYDADYDGAQMTGDPEALAQALLVLERSQGRMWEMMLPGGRVPQPSVLRTHPRTSDRVARLRALGAGNKRQVTAAERGLDMPRGSVPIIPGPRYRMFGTMGLWY